MKKGINNTKKIIAFVVAVATVFSCACSQGDILATEEDYRETFYLDKDVFEDACEKMRQLEWSIDDLDKGIMVIESPQLYDMDFKSNFLKKYNINRAAVYYHKNNIKDVFIEFHITNVIDNFDYCEIYYSTSGEPDSIDLGEYQDDLGMYYYKTEMTQMYECYTERLDEHWFFVRYHYFRY